MRYLNVLTLLALAAAAGPAGADDFFESKVRPVLAEHCFRCHGSDKQKGGIRLDRPDHFRSAPDGSGPLVVPGKPDDSRLIASARRAGDHPMPPDKSLPDAAVRVLTEWVQAGGEFPSSARPRPAGKDHWAFKPVRAPDLPEVKDANWPASPIDQLVLAKLEAKGLTPSPAADSRTLLRRVTYDLTGLPPTVEEMDAFLKDPSEAALAAAVDRLLKSPHFGEHWGRHWLDVARYGESKGANTDDAGRYPFAYTYRDWVVKAFNDDIPYDQFLIKQIAADRLSRTEGHPDLAALGFLTLGRKFDDSDQEIVDDRLDTLFRGTQALTVSCARCHDHKYDPIPIKDYYSLYGVFAGATERDTPLIRNAEDRLKYQAYAAELRARIRSLERFVSAERKRVLGNYREQVEQYLLAAHATAEAQGREAAPEEAEPGGKEADEAPADNSDSKEGDAKPADAKRPDGLHPYLVNRYVAFLQDSNAEHNPIMAPWHAFAALSGEVFATEGKKLAGAFAANADSDKQLNPLVARLFVGKPPADLTEVANRYGKLFTSVSRKWERHLAEADRADTQRPTRLDDDDDEAIRSLIYGEGPLEMPAAVFSDLLGEEKARQHDELNNSVETWRSGPNAPDHARVLDDPENLETPRVFVGGKPEAAGEEVPRRFLAVLSETDPKPFADGSGRLDLARAIASKDNPLTARVWVNRVWGHLFGAGLVGTASDFGARSNPPTHPELLDWLADSLVADGWSTKSLIRRMVLSRLYRQASADRPDCRKADPANVLLWRMNRKRLQAEPLRDSLLAVAGNLNRAVGGRSVNPAEAVLPARRTLYLAVERGNLPAILRTFDFANPDLHSPGRHETTVPQQALFLMNDPFTAEQARGLARAVDASKPGADAAWVRAAYRASLCRQPSADEERAATRFLAAAAALKSSGAEPPPEVWRYGHAAWDGTTKRLKNFTPFAHFQDEQWRASDALPDPKLSHAHLTADGGHPGPTPEQSVVRRWVAPASGVVTVHALLKHQLENPDQPGEADGVRGRIVHGTSVLAEADAFNREARTDVRSVRVARGDTIDFVVEPKANDSNDSFTWKIEVSLVADGRPGQERAFDSAEEFRGPATTDAAPLSPKEKLAQVLLLSNEFVYID